MNQFPTKPVINELFTDGSGQEWVCIDNISRIWNKVEGAGYVKTDGSNPMDTAYSPVSDQDVATKLYVEDNKIVGAVTFKDVFTPALAIEYPASGVSGDLYIIGGLTVPYIETTGDLSGETLENGDSIIYNGTKWLKQGATLAVDLSDYIKSDGTKAMDASYRAVNAKDVATKDMIPDMKGLIRTDGSTDMDSGYNPTNPLSVASKEYVDNSIVNNKTIVTKGSIVPAPTYGLDGDIYSMFTPLSKQVPIVPSGSSNANKVAAPVNMDDNFGMITVRSPVGPAMNISDYYGRIPKYTAEVTLDGLYYWMGLVIDDANPFDEANSGKYLIFSPGTRYSSGLGGFTQNGYIKAIKIKTVTLAGIVLGLDPDNRYASLAWNQSDTYFPMAFKISNAEEQTIKDWIDNLGAASNPSDPAVTMDYMNPSLKTVAIPGGGVGIVYQKVAGAWNQVGEDKAIPGQTFDPTTKTTTFEERVELSVVQPTPLSFASTNTSKVLATVGTASKFAEILEAKIDDNLTKVILKDGSVDMDSAYTAQNPKSVATKDMIPVYSAPLILADGSVDMAANYSPVNPGAVVTKEYFDANIITGALQFKGNHTPQAAFEYPNVNTPVQGDMWLIKLISGIYKFATGDLSGQDARDGDSIIFDGTAWHMQGVDDKDFIPYLKTDGTKLMDAGYVPTDEDGIANKKYVDDHVMSNADVKTAYESNTNTNAFTDALKTKLSGLKNGYEHIFDNSASAPTAAPTFMGQEHWFYSAYESAFCLVHLGNNHGAWSVPVIGHLDAPHNGRHLSDIVYISQGNYDAIGTKNPKTLFIII